MPFFGNPVGPPDIDQLKSKGDADKVIKALAHQDAYVRWSAAAALGEMSGKLNSLTLRSRSIEALGEVALEPSENKTVRWNALKAMGQISASLNDPPLLARAIGTISSGLKDNDSDVRLIAAEALGSLSAQLKDMTHLSWVIEALINALDDPNARVSEYISKTLWDLDEAAEQPLVAALTHKSWKVREGVVGVLDLIGWRPNADENGVSYYAVRGKWEKCIEIGEIAIQPLISILKYPNQTNRQSAAKTLGWIGDAAVPALIETLKDGDKDVRAAASEALLQMRWEPDLSETGAYFWIARQNWSECVSIGAPAILPFMAMLKDNDALIRLAAAWSLGQIGGRIEMLSLFTSAVSALIITLKDENEQVRKASAEALGRIGSKPGHAPLKQRIEKALLESLRDKDSDIRVTAANSLNSIGWKADKGTNGAYYLIALQEWDQLIESGLRAAGVPLLEALEDRNHNVRQNAAGVLEKLGWKADKSRSGAAYWVVKGEWAQCLAIGEAAVEPLKAAFIRRDESSTDAALALGKIAAQLKNANLRKSIVENISLAINDASLREAAVRALGEMGDSGVTLSPLISALKFEDVRDIVTTELVKIGAVAVKPLIDAMRDEDGYKSESGIDVLVKMGAVVAIPPLLGALKEKRAADFIVDALDKLGWKADMEEAGAAYWAARRHWDHCIEIGEPAVEVLIATLEESDERVRSGATEALGGLGERIKNDGLRQRAIGALLAALRDREFTVRRRAAGALDRLGWKREKNEHSAAYWIVMRRWKEVVDIGSAAVDPLVPCLKDRDESVRLAAAEALGKIGDRRAVEALTEALKDRNMHDAVNEALRLIDAANQKK